MNKIVPFKKQIDFESIYQITSISLEHNLSLKEENLIKGNFIISGSYKKTEASINIDEFSFEIPFEINIDSKYDTKDITVDINDFYYEIIDNESLSLNIEIIIEDIYEKEVIMENDDRKIIDIENEEINTEEIPEEKQDNEIKKELSSEKMESIFEGLECNDNFVTYKVHIITENDTIESLIKKYNTKKSLLEEYNNLVDIKIGDKIIIPSDD